jgi:SnoaL-like domain
MRQSSSSSMLAVVALLMIMVPSASAQTDPVSVLEEVNGAFNRGDASAALAGFTDDVIVIGGPCGGAPGGKCVGKEMLREAIQAGGPAEVKLLDPLVLGDRDLVTFRFEERFGWPPQATAAGVQRFVEVGRAVITGGKVSRLGLVPDVTDPQSMTLLRVLSTLGPPVGPGAAVPVARDGQTLGTQPAVTQLQFQSVWGDQASARWVQEHDAVLSRSGT